MSRIRTVKPEFWTSEQVLACSLISRLLFIGMWNFCDDHGVHPASYIRIKAEVFPADDCTIHDVKNWINELIDNNLLREYVIEDEKFWLVTGWKKHQRIDKPTYRHPMPESALKKIDDNSTITHGALAERSPIAIKLLNESSTTERNGRERIGEDINICEAQTSPVDVVHPNSNISIEIFEHWKTVMNHPRAKFDNKRKRIITNALKLGYSVADLKQAIDGCACNPYNMGKNPTNTIYDDIGLIFRDAERIERYMNNATNSANEVQASSIMAGVL